jgi:hypothetical protein
MEKDKGFKEGQSHNRRTYADIRVQALLCTLGLFGMHIDWAQRLFGSNGGG